MRRLPTSTYVLPAGTLGTATAAIVVRNGGAQGTGYRSLEAGTTGEVEWLVTEAHGTPLVVSSWIQDASERPRPILVPGGRVLSARRPAATAGLTGDVLVTVTEEKERADA